MHSSHREPGTQNTMGDEKTQSEEAHSWLLLPVTVHSAFPPRASLWDPQSCVPVQKCPLTNRNLAGVFLVLYSKLGCLVNFLPWDMVICVQRRPAFRISYTETDRWSALSIFSFFLEIKLLSLGIAFSILNKYLGAPKWLMLLSHCKRWLYKRQHPRKTSQP